MDTSIPSAVRPVSARSSDLKVKVLTPTIGAEISGIDLRLALPDQQRDEIKRLILEHRVVFFRDQNLSSEQQIALARRFGKIYIHPLTKDKDGQGGGAAQDAVSSHRISAERDRKLRPFTSGRWHTDTSWLVRPAWGALLRAVDIPAAGGDTMWANGHAVYESLSAELKEKIEDLYVIHDFQKSLKRLEITYPTVAHPLARPHPVTGKKVLFINFAQSPYIVGLDRADSKALVAELLKAYSQPEFHVRFKWSPGALAFWDNGAALHYPVIDYGDYPREMERVLIEDFDALPHY